MVGGREKEKERVEGDTFSCSLSAVLLGPAGTDMTVNKFYAVLAATKFCDLSAARASVRMKARSRFLDLE